MHAVADPVADPALATSQVLAVAAEVRPCVLVGSDTGALFAAGLVASGRVTRGGCGGAGRIAGPARAHGGGRPVRRNRLRASRPVGSWEAELAARTACPTHRGRLAGQGLRRGALYEPVPSGWDSLADLGRLEQPVLALHGAADPVSPLADARERYAQAPRAELVSIAGGVHDVLNDATHRTAAAAIVLFLERLRLGADLPPIAISEKL